MLLVAALVGSAMAREVEIAKFHETVSERAAALRRQRNQSVLKGEAENREPI